MSLSPFRLPLLGLALSAAVSSTSAQSVSFERADKKLSVVDRQMRKWDAPVVADLDQDGWVDLLQNDHGYSTQILWNNQGKYSKPWDMLMGDMHGLTVGDFDRDGLQEIVVSRGGGSGSNARNSVIYKVHKDRRVERMADFAEPLEMMRGRSVIFFDGDNDGDLDLMNFAFPSNEKKGESENYLYENTGDGLLVKHSVLPPSKADGQKILITDFENDGDIDFFMYGHGHVRAFEGDGKLGFVDVTDKVLGDEIHHVTSIVELDYDNDGDQDIFMARGEELHAGANFYDAETQTWGFYAKRGAYEFPRLPGGDVVELENYQSPWPNKKLYLGESGYEYTIDGETFSGTEARIVSSDALGWPDSPNKKGMYLGFVGNGAWRVAGGTWSPLTSVIKGITSAPDGLTETSGLQDLLFENQGGRFKNVSKARGIVADQHSTGSVAVDVNSDGWMDIVTMERGELVKPLEAQIYLNTGQGGFKLSPQHGLVSPELGAIGMGLEAVDTNRDGAMDIIVGNERGLWHLFNNTTKANYLIVDTGAEAANRDTALDATVTLKACGVSQTKRVGVSSASYSRSYNRYMHFGLGVCKKVDKVSVTLSNGKHYPIKVRGVNKTVALTR